VLKSSFKNLSQNCRQSRFRKVIWSKAKISPKLGFRAARKIAVIGAAPEVALHTVVTEKY